MKDSNSFPPAAGTPAYCRTQKERLQTMQPLMTYRGPTFVLPGTKESECWIWKHPVKTELNNETATSQVSGL